MPDPFLAALKDFERVVAEIGEMQERLQSLEAQRDQLRKQLRSLAAGTEVSSAVSLSAPTRDGPPHAVAEIIDAIRALGGMARLADLASHVHLENKVVATRLQRAVKEGLLERVGHGLYKLPNADLKTAILDEGEVVSGDDLSSSEDAGANP